MRVFGLLGILMFSAQVLSAEPSGDGEIRTRTMLQEDGTTQVSRKSKTFLELTIRNPDGTQQKRTYWHLGPKGEFDTSEVYDRADKLVFTEKFFYLASQKVGEIKRFHPDGTLWIRTVFNYDESGQPMGMKVIDPSGREIPPDEWKKLDPK